MKVVLHVMAGNGPDDHYYGVGGSVHRDLEKMTGLKIDLVSFSGVYLHGADLDRFVEECRDATAVITDTWTHPNDSNYGSREWNSAHENMTYAVRRVRGVNPLAPIFAELMEGLYKVDVHKVATPFASWCDLAAFASAIKQSQPKEGQPWVLVFDDAEQHRQAALEQLADVNLVVADTYDRAEELILAVRFDYVLLDLLVPASAKTMGNTGLQYVGQQMPLTPILAFLALSRGVKKVAVLTDAGHHDHPASAALDVLGQTMALGDSKVLLTNRGYLSPQGKRWKELKEQLDK